MIKSDNGRCSRGYEGHARLITLDFMYSFAASNPATTLSGIKLCMKLLQKNISSPKHQQLKEKSVIFFWQMSEG